MEKKQLRQTILKKREQLTQEERLIAAKRAVKQLTSATIFSQSTHIACYLAKDAEMSTTPIIEKIWAENKHCYLPVVHPSQFGLMSFIEYSPKDELIINRFGIQEPILQQDKTIDARNLNLVILPLFAFDKSGNRLGTGGGYYDRAFSFLKESPQSQKPVLCGLAYDFQQVEEIESQIWDISLHCVVTESKIVYFQERETG